MTVQCDYVLQVIGAYLGLRRDLPPASSITEREALHVYTNGLSQVAFACHEQFNSSGDDQNYKLFRSADLTTRVIHRQLREATVEILDTAGDLNIEVVLLKGIAVSEQFYQSPHHRTMGDIDLLVRPQAAKVLQQALISRGFSEEEDSISARSRQRHHHLPVLRHSNSEVAVEIHTALFSRTLITTEPVFDPQSIWDYAESGEFEGQLCRHFVAEFQLLYAVAHWAIDYKWPVNLVSVCDIALMVNKQNPEMKWEMVRAWMKNNLLTASMLTVILLYLERTGLAEVPNALVGEVNMCVRRNGTANIRVLHWLLTTFPIAGRSKVGWVLTRRNARILWLTLLEPHHKFLRLPLAILRIALRRTPGKSLLGSTAGRIRTLLGPNA